MSLHLCHPYVWEDPRYIFKSFMYDGSCMSELVNRVVFIYLLFLVIGFIFGSICKIGGMPLLFGVLATFYLFPVFMKMRAYKEIAEGFADNDSEPMGTKGRKEQIDPMDILEGMSPTGPTGPNGSTGPMGPAGPMDDMNETGQEGTQLERITSTTSSARNPFQNVLVDDYKYSPTRAAAPSISSPDAKVALDSMFRTQWYSDPTDVFGKTQGQRMFLTQPNTTVPNDQGSYQNWLYKIPGKTCKEGGREACLPGTDGAVIPWLNQNQ